MGAKRIPFIFNPSFSILSLFSSFSSFVFVNSLIVVFLLSAIIPVFAQNPEAESSVSQQMIIVSGGTFLMGQIKPHLGDRFLSSNEQPIHRSTLDDFSIGLHEFTLGDAYLLISDSLKNGILEIEDNVLYLKEKKDKPLFVLDKSMLKQNPSLQEVSLVKGFENHPLTGVTWYGALFLCNSLSIKEKIPLAYNLATWQYIEGSVGYRLPFEAEWEYAARNGGWEYRYNKKEEKIEANIADISFSKEASKHSFESDINDGYPSLAPVGSFPLEENQLYDMRGNVQEWCYDYYSERYFEEAVPRNNPSGPGEGVSRVSRGGDWQSLYIYTRPTARTHWKPETAEMFLGFRMARSLPFVSEEAEFDE